MKLLFEPLGNARLHSVVVDGNIGPSFVQWTCEISMHSLHGEVKGRDADREGRRRLPRQQRLDRLSRRWRSLRDACD